MLPSLVIVTLALDVTPRPRAPTFTRGGLIAAAVPLALSPLRAAAMPDPMKYGIDDNPVLAELSKRLVDETPTQQQASLLDTIGTPFGRTDNLIFPPWLEGEWQITSNILGVAAPLGRRFLPDDLARVRLGVIAPSDGVPPLQYRVQFVRRSSDGAVVSDRENNLRAVQDASAGYQRVQSVDFDGSATLKIQYSPFGKNGTFPGPSRAEVFIQRRRESSTAASDRSVFSELPHLPHTCRCVCALVSLWRVHRVWNRFAFAEATRTVLLAQGGHHQPSRHTLAFNVYTWRSYTVLRVCRPQVDPLHSLTLRPSTSSDATTPSTLLRASGYCASSLRIPTATRGCCGRRRAGGPWRCSIMSCGSRGCSAAVRLSTDTPYISTDTPCTCHA